jgi:hypothetical protein
VFGREISHILALATRTNACFTVNNATRTLESPLTLVLARRLVLPGVATSLDERRHCLLPEHGLVLADLDADMLGMVKETSKSAEH